MEKRIRTIVVGVAAVDQQDPQLAPAIKLAEEQEAALHVVYAYHLPDPVLYPYPEMEVFSPETLREIEQRAQAQLEAEVRQVSSNDRISCHAVPMPADAAILGVAEEVGGDLVIVGATRRGKLGRAILGTTAQRVVRAARTPVLVARRPDYGLPRRVLLTTDLSENSARVYERGLELVATFVRKEASELRLLLVAGFEAPPTLPKQLVLDTAAPRLEHFLTSVDPDAPSTRGKIRTGDPAREIVAEAAEWPADLLVVGTHGRKGPSRLLIGSVAEAVVRNALCDVLVIPAAAFAAAQESSAAAGEEDRADLTRNTDRVVHFDPAEGGEL